MIENRTADGCAEKGHGVSIEQKEVSRNSKLLVMNGAMMFAGFTFASYELILPAFVQTLTASSFFVGVTGTLMRLGWSMPQVFAGRIVEPMSRKMPVYAIFGSVQTLMWLGIGAFTIFLGTTHPTLLLVAFLVLYGLAMTCMGISSVPRMDIMGKAFHSSIRARVFAYRRLAGGGMSMIAGVSIGYVLGDAAGLAFPTNYGVLFLASGICIGLSVVSFSMIREPIEQAESAPRLTLREYVGRGIETIKVDRNYRRLCILQFLWGFSAMGAPFYMPYALTDLGMDVRYVGFFSVVLQLSSIGSNVVWAWIGQSRGNHALLPIGTCLLGLSLLFPLTVSLVPPLPIDLSALLGSTYAIDTQVAYFSLTFVCSGAAWSGMFTGRMTYILDIAPADRRPTYTSFMNAFMMPDALLPIIAGTLVAWISYHNLFLVSCAFVPIAIYVSLKLEAVVLEQ